MSERDGLLGAIDTCYAAALDPARWPDALGQVIAVLGGAGGTLSLVDTRTRAQPLWVQQGLDRGDEYLAYAQHIDPAVAYACAHPDCVIQYDYLYMDEWAIDRHPYYAWLQRRGDFRYYVSGRIFATSGLSGFVSIQRRRGQGHVQRAQLRRMEALLPHLQRATAAAVKLDTLQARIAIDDALLERGGCAVLCLDAGAKVVRMNARAEALVSASDGLTIGGRRLLVRSVSVRAAFERRLRAAIAEPGLDGETTAALSIPRPSGKTPYVVQVTRVPTRLPGYAQVAALVLVVDPEVFPASPRGLLRQLYGLTHAESVVACGLANGTSVAELAAGLGVARSTVRTHLDSVLRKTRTHRQAALVSLVLRLARAQL